MRSSFTLTLIGDSMAVPHTSPSPCATCGSPIEYSAPFTLIGRYSSTPSLRSRISMLPPVAYGGMVLKLPASAGATPVVPQKGFTGTRAKEPKAAGEEKLLSYDQMCNAGLGKSSAKSPKLGITPVQAQPDGSKPSIVTLSVSPGSAPS